MPGTTQVASEPLAVLAEAVSDVGYWRWWYNELPVTLGIELGGVQLMTASAEEGGPPGCMVLLGFKAPLSVAFLVREGAAADLPPDWPELLQDEKIEPLTFERGALAFDHDECDAILADAKTVKVVHGLDPLDPAVRNAGARLAFWAGPVGMAVAAEKMAVVDHEGLIPLEEIPSRHEGWWQYWKRYWDLKGTPGELPVSFACEATRPVGDE